MTEEEKIKLNELIEENLLLIKQLVINNGDIIDIIEDNPNNYIWLYTMATHIMLLNLSFCAKQTSKDALLSFLKNQKDFMLEHDTHPDIPLIKQFNVVNGNEISH